MEIAGLYALIALAVYALRDRIPELNTAPVAVRLTVGTIVGLTLLHAHPHARAHNLIPDALEPLTVIAFVATLFMLVLRRR